MGEEEEEVLPDHLRCKRTDGRKWRCSRRVMDNVKLCEIHYLQGRHRQYKEKVPESLKLQRKRKKGLNKDDSVLNNVEVKARKVVKMAKMMRKRIKVSDDSESMEAPVGKKVSKQGNKQLELIRMVLKREVEKRKKKKKMKRKEEEEEQEELHYSDGELTKELPNGLMAISMASTAPEYCNVGSQCDVKLCVDHKAITPRYFRSKNVERLPEGKLQVLPYERKCKRKKCHWCQRSDSWNLIKCSSCQKEFFCMDCIKERYFDTQNEVKMACPVCRGTCSCKDCLRSKCKDNETKEFLAGKSKVDRILHFHYLVCTLLPILKQINEDLNAEIETEAKFRGKRPSDIHIKQVECCGNDQAYCNQCKTPFLDLHRSCPICSYSLCMSCCRQSCQRNSSEEIITSISESSDGMDACLAGENHLLDKKAITNGNSVATFSLHKSTKYDGIGDVSCPPKELGGCGDKFLELRCVFPLSQIKEMEVTAEEIVCSYDFPETLDKSSSCSLCPDTDNKLDGFKQLQEAALREDSKDNWLFYPTVLDIGADNFEHFQKHWGKGHPVVVQDVLRNTSNLSWDPLVMFCTYLEGSISRYENDKDELEACLDWCEVEINIKQCFTGSLKCQPQKNMWHDMLKLKWLLSSQLFKEWFPAHFADSDFVTKLSYDSYDVVNIMAHTTDVPLSTEQLTKIRKLLKRHRSLCRRDSSEINADQLKEQGEKVYSLPPAEDIEMTRLHRKEREEKHFSRRVNRTACIITEATDIASQNTDSKISQDEECDSDSDSENPYGNSNNDRDGKFIKHYGAQWDVFRRQDVPKLLEYLKRHSAEFSPSHDNHKQVDHPLLDQSFFLDNTHKMRLKEEYKIEPWTFVQHVGEAVIIPAGCPYQIRNSKCCVHVVLEFVSPENAAECIQLIDEARQLPEDHKANVDHLEVKKMALYSIDSAIKEIRELTSKT
ncbi:hypothetical protein K1719_008194 [Acacia pycnantha]|nr:hypothetical protein K1719_008194 [Acacia pycnantha]